MLFVLDYSLYHPNIYAFAIMPLERFGSHSKNRLSDVNIGFFESLSRTDSKQFKHTNA
jgi:hypothetical protein